MAVKQTEYEWIYLWASVNPHTGESCTFLTPTVNTDYMNAYLQQLRAQVGPNRHVILVLDGAGWHVSKNLQIPENLTLHHLPPYSPELNPVERIWHYLRQHYLSNRIYHDYDHLEQETRSAINHLSPSQLRQLCCVNWVERVY